MEPHFGRRITFRPHNHILTNSGVWSPDSQWIVYDTRPDAEGSVFDGDRIEMVNVETGEIRELYRSQDGARCGVATFNPSQNRVVFILGPEHPTPEWSYGPAHRQGVLVDIYRPGRAENLDARDLSPPRTPGALRGGSHVHLFSPDGQWVSFTYNDALLASLTDETDDHDTEQRNVGVCFPAAGGVSVPKDSLRNADGAYFAVLVTRTTARPRPSSDDITMALEQGWIGTNGYLRTDGTRQLRALAFQGTVLTADNRPIPEVFVVDIRDNATIPSSDGPLEGTATRRPAPPLGTIQRRLTFTADRKFPGIQGPRHWLQSSPDGTQVAFLMRDDAGIAQIWTISPNGGTPRQVTRDPWSVASAFTWSPDGRYIAYAADNSVFVAVAVAAAGTTRRLTQRSPDDIAPLALACVFAPDGQHIAFLRRVSNEPSGPLFNQIFVANLNPEEPTV